MIGVDNVIDRIIEDLLVFNMGSTRAQFSWKLENKEAIVAPELDEITIDTCRSDSFLITHQSEGWSIIKFIGNKKPYQYQGSMDDIIAWCLAIKLKLNY